MSCYRPKYKDGTRGRVYLFDFERGGLRFTGSTKRTRKADAENYEKSLQAQIEEELKSADNRGSTPVLTIKEACERYWNEFGRFQKNSKTVRTDLDRMLDMFCPNLSGPDTLLSAVTDAEVSEFVARRRGQHGPNDKLLAPRTVNAQTVKLVRRVFKKVVDTWKVKLGNDWDEPAWIKHTLKTPGSAKREVTPDQQEIYFAHLREDYRDIVQFMALTGVRRAESLIKKTQVDWSTMEITVIGKGDKTRTLPITNTVAMLIERNWNNHPEYLWTYLARRAVPGRELIVKGRHYPITVWGLREQTDRASRNSGIKITRHNWRHTAGSRIARTAGLATTQEVLGHADVETTRKFYVHVTSDDKMHGLEQAEEWANKSRRKSRKTRLKGV